MPMNPAIYVAESTTRPGTSFHPIILLYENPPHSPHQGSGVVVHFQLFEGQCYDPEALCRVNLKFTHKISWHCSENNTRLAGNIYYSVGTGRETNLVFAKEHTKQASKQTIPPHF